MKHTWIKTNAYNAKCQKCGCLRNYNGIETNYILNYKKTKEAPKCDNSLIVNWSHSYLCKKGSIFLKKFCSIVLVEKYNYSIEIPDVIGFRSDFSFVLEAKTSLSDFNNDLKKKHRTSIELGMGDFRFYITKTGLIDKSKLPIGWGLLELDNEKKINVIHNPFGSGSDFLNWSKNKKNLESENKILYQTLYTYKKNEHK